MITRQTRIQERTEAVKKARRYVREEARFAADRLANLSVSSPIPSVRFKAQRALAALSQISRGDIDADRVTEVSTALEAISGGVS
jgi:hypothetical protein